MGLRREEALAETAAGIGAVEDREMLGLEMGGALERHGPRAIGVGGLDLVLAEAECCQHVEADIVELRRREAEDTCRELLAERPLVEGEADVEGAGEGLLQGLEGAFVEALLPQRLVIDAWRPVERAMADGVADDVLDLRLGVAEGAQRERHRAVDDLEIAAARQLLELDEGEIRLDPGGVAIHDEADRARR